MRRFSKNILSLLTADVIRRLLGFISVAFLARILGKEDFGVINIGFAVLAYSMVLGAAGFSVLGTKRIAQGDSPELIGRIIGSRLITTIFVLTIVAVVTLTLVSDSKLAFLIILFSCAILPQIFFLDWYFQGKETMGPVSMARVLQAVVYLITILAFVRTSNDVIWVAIGSILGECSAAVMLYVRFHSSLKDAVVRLKPSLNLLRQSVPLAVGLILATLIINYPPIALGVFTTKSDVGIYSAANKLVYSLLMGDRILLLLLIPASSRKYVYAKDDFREMLNEALKWIVILGLPIAVGGSLVADNLIILIFGSEYVGSAVVLKVLIWFFLLTMLHTVFTSALIGAGGEKSYSRIMLITAFIYLFTVSLGTYWYAVMGAAFGVVIAEGFGVLLMSRSLRKLVPLHSPGKLIRIFFSVLVMAICVIFVLQYGLLCALIAGIISYSIILFAVRAVNRNDLKLLIARF